jgi:nucleoid DNA-binding protein
MEKPSSMTLKVWFIKEMAKELNLEEKIITTVINDQFNRAYEALTTNNSVEISGFGKFVFNHRKAEWAMKKFKSQEALFSSIIDSPDSSPAKKKNAELKLVTALKNIEDLNKKL